MIRAGVIAATMEDLAGAALLGRARSDPGTFLEHVLETAGAIASSCTTCRSIYALIPTAAGSTGVSHGICPACEPAVRKSFGLGERRA